MCEQLTIGVYPFGLAAGPDGIAAGRPDDFSQIRRALDQLRGSGPPLLTRAYVIWSGAQTTAAVLDQITALLDTDLTWDLVLAYRDREADIESWCAFVAQVLRCFGRQLAAVQVTGEPNLNGIPDAGDGGMPRVIEALTQGVASAAQTKREVGASADIGFAVVPDRGPGMDAFWLEVAARGGAQFAANVDYAGLDMYPDVFGGRVPLGEVDAVVGKMLWTFRHRTLPLVGIGPSTPIRVCENGWPTGPDRPEDQQAAVLDAVLQGVRARQHELNITHWELFALRDADSARDDPFYQFGILRDDYSPKPAFDRLRNTLARL